MINNKKFQVNYFKNNKGSIDNLKKKFLNTVRFLNSEILLPIYQYVLLSLYVRCYYYYLL